MTPARHLNCDGCGQAFKRTVSRHRFLHIRLTHNGHFADGRVLCPRCWRAALMREHIEAAARLVQYLGRS